MAIDISRDPGYGRAKDPDMAFGDISVLGFPVTSGSSTGFSDQPSDSTAPGHQHGFRWQHRLLILASAPLYLQFHRFPQHMNHPASFSLMSPSCTLSFPTLHYIFVHLNITCCSDPRGLGPELVCYVPGCPRQPQIRNLNKGISLSEEHSYSYISYYLCCAFIVFILLTNNSL